MGETQVQTWVRRGSNAKLEAAAEVIDIPPTPPTHGEGRRLTPFHGMSSGAKTASSIAAWYCSNIGVLILNKYLLSVYGFRYPIFLTMLHMCACSAYSYLAIAWLELVPAQLLVSRGQFTKVVALSAIFSFSVVSGNTSLRYLPVSFNQAIGATTPVFTAVFAVVLTNRREPPAVYLALAPVVFGIAIASRSEPMFHLLGFFFCLGSTAGRALKSVVQGMLLASDSEKLDSMNLLMYMSPVAAALLLPFTLLWEGNVLAVVISTASEHPSFLLLLLANMSVAYLVNLSNFLVTKHTSALTLQVLGNAKAAVAAFISVLIFRNPVTLMGVTGFLITVAGVVIYGEAKKRFRPLLH